MSTSPNKFRWIQIIFEGERTLKFKFPVQVDDEDVAQRLLDEALKQPTVNICADDQLYVIPTSAIQTIIVSPAPAKLPRMVITGATVS